jgi:hypothetical protein
MRRDRYGSKLATPTLELNTARLCTQGRRTCIEVVGEWFLVLSFRGHGVETLGTCFAREDVGCV